MYLLPVVAGHGLEQGGRLGVTCCAREAGTWDLSDGGENMRTLTTLGLAGLLSLGISSPAMCFVRGGTDSQQTMYARVLTETWRPVSGLRVQSLPTLHDQVLADNKDNEGKNGQGQDEKGQYAQGKDGEGTDAQDDGDHGQREGGDDHDRDRDHDHDHGRHHHPHSGDE